jgi:hypothetical protein
LAGKIWPPNFGKSGRKKYFKENMFFPSRPKILQNNSKPAVGKKDWPEKFGRRILAKAAEKNILKKTCFSP